MSKQERKRKLAGPWHSLHGAVWLIGLAILFWKGWFWPGILVLIAVSAVLEAFLMAYVPHAAEDVEPPSAPAPTVAPLPPPVPATAARPEHPLERLPSTCPKCGGPIRGHEVKWTGPLSADCPYCGANLPLQGTV